MLRPELLVILAFLVICGGGAVLYRAVHRLPIWGTWAERDEATQKLATWKFLPDGELQVDNGGGFDPVATYRYDQESLAITWGNFDNPSTDSYTTRWQGQDTLSLTGRDGKTILLTRRRG